MAYVPDATDTAQPADTGVAAATAAAEFRALKLYMSAVLLAAINTKVTTDGALGTPSSGNLANCTGYNLPVANLTGVAAGIATFLATPNSANLRAAVTDESGTGALLFADGALGTPASGTLTNASGLPISGLTGLGANVATALAAAANAANGIVTPGGAATLTNKTITGYTETVSAPAAGAAFSPDISTATAFVYTTNANTTITLPTPVAGKSFTVDIIFGGAHTITWAMTSGTLRWPIGTAPAVTSVAGKRDKFSFQSNDATNTHGSVIGQNYAA